MSENQINAPEEQEIDLSAIFNLLIGKWYWFAISAFIFLALGGAYIYFTPKEFHRQATILVKDQKNGGGANSQMAAFSDMAGLSGFSISNVENEMQILKSRSIMENVIAKTGLNITYYINNKFRDIEIYETLPLKVVEAVPGTLIPADFIITPLSEEKFTLGINDTIINGEFNKETIFPFGVATVTSYPINLKSYIDTPIEVNIINHKKVADSYLKRLQTSLVGKNSSIVNIEVTSSRPGKANDLINTLLEVYNQDAIDEKNYIIDNTQKFIEERLAAISSDLSEVDGRIEGYKRKTLSTNALTESQIYMQSANQLEENYSKVQLQSSLVNILSDFLSKPQNKKEPIPYNIGLDNAGLNAQIQNYNETLIKMNRLLTASSDRNPVVADMNASLETARNSIEKTVADMKRSVDIQIRDLTSRTNKATGRIEMVATNERSVQSITRDQTIKSELYLYLLNKSEENSIARSMTEANARIVDYAFGDDIPVKPRKAVILLACFIIGLILPAAFFIIKDMFYTKVRGRSDVTKIVKAPILGEIPKKSEEKKDEYIVVRQGSNSQVSESFRILRTNMSFMDISGKSRVIALTSTVPGEGKTYVSVNFSTTMSLAGKKVCLIGLDLRRPTMQVSFGYKGKNGVSDYLAQKETDILKLVLPSNINDNLYILPAGTIPPNPAELLMSSRFDEMVNSLKEQFDYVVIDNPPMNVVADTGIANRVADMTFYVIRAGVLDRRELESIQDVYSENKLKNMGIVITDVDYEMLHYSVGYKGYGKAYGSYGSYGSHYYNEK